RRLQWSAGPGNAPSPYYGWRTAPRWEDRYGSCAITCRRFVRSDRSRSNSIPAAPLGHLPTEGVGEAVDPHDLPERAARHTGVVAADAFEEIEPARIRLGCCLSAHPADDLFRISEEGENRSRRRGDLGLASDDERFIHRCLLGRTRSAEPKTAVEA